MKKILSPAEVLLSWSVASHTCTFGNSTELVEYQQRPHPKLIYLIRRHCSPLLKERESESPIINLIEG
jgi:hypothetical protein